MAETETTMADSTEPTEPTATEPTSTGPTEPAEDWKARYDKLLAQSRKWEERAKSNSAAAKRLAELEDASKTDAERLADATKRAEEAEAKVAEYERRAERQSVVSEVAASKGVDAEWLGRMTGDTREDIEANADFIAAKVAGSHIYPSVPDGGAKKAAPVTREQIDAIRDPKERVRVRAQHLDLYKTNKK